MKKKILIVDDEPQMLKAIRIRLEANGYEVEAAGDGRQGLKMVKEFKPDLILLDIIMPNMDGNIVAATLRGQEETKNIPIVYLTCLVAEAEEKDLELKMGSKRTQFLAKPFDAEKLLGKIRNILET